jgi:hypothetical protein
MDHEMNGNLDKRSIVPAPDAYGKGGGSCPLKSPGVFGFFMWSHFAFT